MRHTELKRKTPLVAKVPLKPGTKKINAVSKTKKRRREQAAGDKMSALRRIILKRCGGRCEQCGGGIDIDTMEAHHRKYRSRGGRDEVVNLVALCTNCHIPWAHGKPVLAMSLGFNVSREREPFNEPVRIHGRWVFLHSDGTYWAAAPSWLSNNNEEEV